MPGLHLLCSTNSSQPISYAARQKFLKTLPKMRHFKWYETDILYDSQDFLVGRSFYKGYPFAVSEDNEYVTVVEGVIYNKSKKKIREELSDISLASLSSEEVAKRVKAFVLSSHGEFLVVKCDRSKGKCLVVNDSLGRLPFYYSSVLQPSNLIIMSREVKFLVPHLQGFDFDKTAIGEYLLFGYPLGERTQCIRLH